VGDTGGIYPLDSSHNLAPYEVDLAHLQSSQGKTSVCTRFPKAIPGSEINA
jgi:hypothetical protein